jgi:cytosine/adenosine deaminase-related metal-dependent hydrolase
VEKIDSLPKRRCNAGLSPHAPYSTTPALLRRCAAAARRRQWRVVTHVAESIAEFEMFQHGRGEMFDWLRRNQRQMTDCGQRSPVQHLAQTHLLGPHLLAVHVNYLSPGDAQLLARKRVSVVHCPRSHDFFQHLEFPRSELDRAGVNLCLGTDSLATVRTKPRQSVDLNLFTEMRQFVAKHPDLPPQQILRMATMNGAHALGMAGDIGELSRGSFADLIALPFSGKTTDSWAATLEHSGDVAMSMIDGHWAIPVK